MFEDMFDFDYEAAKILSPCDCDEADYEYDFDDFDYESAGLFSPNDCNEDNPPRICCGCKFESICIPRPENKDDVFVQSIK